MSGADARVSGRSVETARLVKTYGGVTAVDDVSLTVGAGEFVSLLGPSGSGKTTLLMMIAGFETPTSGVIRIGSRDVTWLSPNKRDIGMVFQRYALFPHMTIANNIAFPLKMRGLPKAEIGRKVHEALSLVRLEGYGERMPAQLSGGQQQRIAVARAIVYEPPVLLMDEPLGALDKKLREQLQLEIARLQRRLGVTVVYVTHDQEEALTMSDRVAVMDKGAIAQIGSPLELYRNPASTFVADFVGKMNFIEGDALGADGPDECVRIGGQATIRARRRTPVAPGSRVKAAIRPERLQALASGRGGAGAIPGVVEASIFIGSFHLLLVRLDGGGGEPLQIQMAGSDAPLPQTGDRVDVVVEAEAVTLFAIDAG